MTKFSPEYILIIEDNPADVFFAKQILKEEKIGTHFQVIKDGETAWEFLTNNSNKMPDLIFLDLHLPKINGYELLKMIRTDEKLRSIPIIILTISKETNEFIDSLVNRMEYYCVKPLNKNDIHKIMKSMSLISKKLI